MADVVRFDDSRLRGRRFHRVDPVLYPGQGRVALPRRDDLSPEALQLGSEPGPQRHFGVGWALISGPVTLGGAILPSRQAGEPFTDAHDFHEVVNGCPPALRAQEFPRAISFKAAFSSSASANSRFRVEFSFSRSLSRLASSAFNRQTGSASGSTSAQRPQLTANIGDVLSLAEQSIGLSQFAYHLLRGVPLPRRHE
jgi:hypothetical protein